LSSIKPAEKPSTGFLLSSVDKEKFDQNFQTRNFHSTGKLQNLNIHVVNYDVDNTLLGKVLPNDQNLSITIQESHGKATIQKINFLCPTKL
jgi:hypothetical protein